MTLHKRILVVEDDPIFRSILEGNLKFEDTRYRPSGADKRHSPSSTRSDLIFDTGPDLARNTETDSSCARCCNGMAVFRSSSSQREAKGRTNSKGSIWVRRITSQSPLTSKSCSRGFELYSGALSRPRSITFRSVASSLISKANRPIRQESRHPDDPGVQDPEYPAERQGQVVPRDELAGGGVGLRHSGDPHPVRRSGYLSTSSENRTEPASARLCPTAHRDGYCLTKGY